MDTVCKINRCNGCMACVNKCAKGAITVVDNIKHYNAVIDTDKCVNCHACEKVCPVNNNVDLKKPISILQGWANDTQTRKTSSSGGVATAVSCAFIKNGGVVCSCYLKKGRFVFKIIKNVNELHMFQGSKYVKSNPMDAYKAIDQSLRCGKKVLFIGLPCQCDGIKRYFSTELQKNLYTIDLICHGSPSPKILKKFLLENKTDAENVESLDFRKKTFFSLYVNRKKIVPDSVKDRYMIMFLSGICYTENCYHCRYAALNRVSDITLGDSWGSELSVKQQEKGISLVLCQTEKGKQLIESADLHLEAVDSKKAVKANHQLQSPTPITAQRDTFFDSYFKTGNVSKSVRKCFPKICLKQDIKAILIRLNLLK